MVFIYTCRITSKTKLFRCTNIVHLPYLACDVIIHFRCCFPFAMNNRALSFDIIAQICLEKYLLPSHLWVHPNNRLCFSYLSSSLYTKERYSIPKPFTILLSSGPSDYLFDPLFRKSMLCWQNPTWEHFLYSLDSCSVEFSEYLVS